MLLGREHEQRAIAQAMARARSGVSATLAIAGEPGIGKTALLDWARADAEGMQVLRVRGIESEAGIPFGSLLELLRPALRALDRVPSGQKASLEAALALRPGRVQERFAVGAAVLSLLAAYAEEQPLLVIVDDAQWLDVSSAQAIRFAVRRLMADPVAALIAVRDDDPSLLDDADLPTLHLTGVTGEQAGRLLPHLSSEQTRWLHRVTAGNPLALLELGVEIPDTSIAPADAPVLVSARITQAFLRRARELSDESRSALLLVATSDIGELALLQRVARILAIDLEALSEAEAVGLVAIDNGVVAFRHPLAQSAVYAGARPDRRRAVHRALAAALPDRDVDRRAWHLAAAAVGPDDRASGALEHAAERARNRSAYATAATAFERAAHLSETGDRRATLTRRAAGAAWDGGLADHAAELVQEGHRLTTNATDAAELDALHGVIAAQRGPLMTGHAILIRAAQGSRGDRAVELLAEAAGACFYAGRPSIMLETARRARTALPEVPSVRSRFLVAITNGMAGVLGGDPAAGAEEIRTAVTLAQTTPGLQADPALLGWLALGPIFLRNRDEGRPLLDAALATARDRAALGILPYILNLIARDQATTDRWADSEATYEEAITLARESEQATQLAFAVAGLAWLQARRGREQACRSEVTEALRLCQHTGARLHEVWATAALGELELGLGNVAPAIDAFERQQRLLEELGLIDPDLSPAPELVEAYLRIGRAGEAVAVAKTFVATARAKQQPWSLARALRSEAMVADDTDGGPLFEQALRCHAETRDGFETARTRLAYGERLRRTRNRVAAREQLRAAAQAFQRLGAAPCLRRALAELDATGARARRRDPSLRDELTPQELQIAQLLAGGKTTRQTAAALFLSPKTVEYHLRHVYQKLSINRRDQLVPALRDLSPTENVTAAGEDRN